MRRILDSWISFFSGICLSHNSKPNLNILGITVFLEIASTQQDLCRNCHHRIRRSPLAADFEMTGATCSHSRCFMKSAHFWTVGVDHLNSRVGPMVINWWLSRSPYWSVWSCHCRSRRLLVAFVFPALTSGCHVAWVPFYASSSNPCLFWEWMSTANSSSYQLMHLLSTAESEKRIQSIDDSLSPLLLITSWFPRCASDLCASCDYFYTSPSSIIWLFRFLELVVNDDIYNQSHLKPNWYYYPHIFWAMKF